MQDNQMLVDEWLWKELKAPGICMEADLLPGESLGALVASMPASWFKYSLTNLIQEIEAAQ